MRILVISLLLGIPLALASSFIVSSIWQVVVVGPYVRFLGVFSAILTRLKYPLTSIELRSRPAGQIRARFLPLVEIAAIVLWALWVGHAYLDFRTWIWPAGGEFGTSIQTHFIWALLDRCGPCVFWNGFIQGGAPAFAELHGSPLHPLIILTTLLWGAVNGAKASLLASLAMAGLGQWWLAKVMRLGRVAALWSAGLAVSGGYLAGRMEVGALGLVLSAAACSLILAPGLDLALRGRRRSAILLGVTAGFALTAGQGYMQVGMLLGLLPAFAIFLFDQELHLRPVWREFVLAGGVALLVAAYFLVPLGHFGPNIQKDQDVNFEMVQPLQYLPLNLVISDPQFYQTDALLKFPGPYIYTNYIGWIPVLFAVLAIRLIPSSGRRTLVFLLAAIALVYLVATSATLRLIGLVLPDLAAGVRNCPLAASLVVPPLLALAAWGLDCLLKLGLSKLPPALPPMRKFAVALSVLLLALLLIWSLRSTYVFSQLWIKTLEVDPNEYEAVRALKTATTEWISVPFGKSYWVTPALEADLKIGDGMRTWQWKGHGPAPVARIATTYPVDDSSARFVRQIGLVNLWDFDGREYAYVSSGLGMIPCRAAANGGDIDVDCRTTASGFLVVHEYYWSGWQLWRDGEPVRLLETGNQWLLARAPAGNHHYEFRYRPWDVVIGLVLTAFGLGLAAYLWRRDAAI